MVAAGTTISRLVGGEHRTDFDLFSVSAVLPIEVRTTNMPERLNEEWNRAVK